MAWFSRTCLSARNARAASQEPQPFDEDQANCFLAAVAGDPDEAVFALAITTGMRQGELLGLRWQDIDLEHAQLTVNMAVQRIGETERRRKDYALAAPKTAHSQRKIALTKTVALPALKAHLAKIEHSAASALKAHLAKIEHSAASGLQYRDQGFVFPDRLGDLRTPGSLYYHFKRIL